MPADIPAEQRDMLYQFYASVESRDEFMEKYRDLVEGISSLKFLTGFCYTQLTDVEQEINGLLTYERRPKAPPQTIADINHELFKNYS